MTNKIQFWAIVPAAGSGKRMQSSTPKQYLRIHDKTILEHTLHKLDKIPEIKGIIVAVSDDDTLFSKLKHIPPNTIRITGGKERCNSVLNGLQYLLENNCGDDWALVHDAARPCVNKDNIQKLLSLTSQKQRGGILASPVSDTLKVAYHHEIQKTIDRQHLWQAHTPQAFPIQQLSNAITHSISKGITITDEASAIEAFGIRPLIVPDSRDNIKVTQPEDLGLAEFILRRQNLL